MSRHLALLRAVNLGGRNKVPMAKLRALAEGLGFADVSTFIASGNLLFTSPDAPKALATRLTGALASEFGFDIDVVVVDAALLRHAVHDHPFADGDPRMVHVGFSDRPIPDTLLPRLREVATEHERYAVDGTLLFADYGAGGLHTSKSAPRIAPALKPGFATLRNYQTTAKLLDMLES